MSEGNGNSVLYLGPDIFRPMVEAQWKAAKPYLLRKDTPTVVAGQFERQPGGALVPNGSINRKIGATVQPLFDMIDHMDGCSGCAGVYSALISAIYDTSGEDVAIRYKCPEKIPEDFLDVFSGARDFVVGYDFSDDPRLHFDPGLGLIVAGGFSLFHTGLFLKLPSGEVPKKHLKGYHLWDLASAKLLQDYNGLKRNVRLCTNSEALYAEKNNGLKVLTPGENEAEAIAFEESNKVALDLYSCLGEIVHDVLHEDPKVLGDFAVFNPLLARAVAFASANGPQNLKKEAIRLIDAAAGKDEEGVDKLLESGFVL